MTEQPQIDPRANSRLYSQAPPMNIKRSYFKMGAILVFVAAGIAIVHFTPLKAYLTDLSAAKQVVLSTGYWAPLIYFFVAGASIFIGAPRLPFCVLGGMLFGLVNGLILSQAATLVGAYGPFLFGRYGTRAWVDRKLRRLGKVHKYLRNSSIFDIFMFRQIPIWGVFTNLALGSVGVSHIKFIFGSLLGFLPQAIIFTLIGSGLAEESFLQALSKIWTAIPVLVIGGFVTWRLVVRAKKQREAAVNPENGQGR